MRESTKLSQLLLKAFVFMLLLRLSAALETRPWRSSRPVAIDLYHSSQLPASERLEIRGVEGQLTNQFTWYGIRLAIGTPPQIVTLQIDTGSSDMWVANSTFTPMLSSTYRENLTDPFEIRYGDGSGAAGTYAQDTITLLEMNNVTLHQANFAFAPLVRSYPQVCGIGLAANEVKKGPKYSNLPMQLKEQGHISALMYSMRLGSYKAPGQLIFGGVDHSQYEGQLQVVPIASESSFTIQMDGIYQNNQTVYGTPTEVLLDSGTTNLLLPGDMINALIHAIQPDWEWSLANEYAVNCSQITEDAYFELDFSGARLRLPYKNIVDSTSLSRNGSIPASGTCGLGIQMSTRRVILGDRFLVGVYVVYDLENHEIALANVRKKGLYSNSTTGGGLEPVHDDGTIPGAVRAPKYVNAMELIVTSASEAVQPTSRANFNLPTFTSTSSLPNSLKPVSSMSTSSSSSQNLGKQLVWPGMATLLLPLSILFI